ncbi:MAG TPA: hypothetical protein VD813_05705, partial [Pseudonocardia sp.]|nr:hypothetical protein [Pseudonocardia sp.]
IGAAIGTAALAGLFYAVLSATTGDHRVAVAVALGGAVLAICGALVIAVFEWRRGRRRERSAALGGADGNGARPGERLPGEDEVAIGSPCHPAHS